MQAKRLNSLVSAAVVAGVLGAALLSQTLVAGAAAGSWKPEKHVELIVPTAAGSGVDNTGRTIQAILQSRKIVETPVNVVNRPGGNYGVGLAYAAQPGGEGHRLVVQTSTPLAAYITGTLAVNYAEYTPLAMLISEPIVFVVRADSSLKAGKDLLARLKADPESVSIAIAAARGNVFHIVGALVARAGGADIRKMKIVVFGSSGEGIAALLGGHVDMFLVTPGNFLPLIESGKVRVLGISSDRRAPGPLATVPTWKEQGADVEIEIWRGVMGPPRMTAAQVAYWDNAFGQMVKSEEWQAALKKNQWADYYRNSADTAKQLKVETGLLRAVLGELGMAK